MIGKSFPTQAQLKLHIILHLSAIECHIRGLRKQQMQSIMNFWHDSESILNMISDNESTLRGVCCMTTTHDLRNINQYMRDLAFLDEPDGYM